MITAIGQLSSPGQNTFLKIWKTLVDPATRMFQDHRHINFEIAMVCRGSGVYHTVNGQLPILPGDVFVFPSNEAHYILQVHGDGLELVNLHFNHGFFSSCAIAQTYPNLFFSHSDGFLTRIPAEQSQLLRQLLQQMVTELQEHPEGYGAALSSYLNLFLLALMRQHGYYCPQEGTHTSIEKILGGLDYIHSHYCENITLQQIADHSGLSPNYFTALFRQHFKLKLWDYILSKRIDKAKMLLSQNESMTVLEVAVSCGFNNTANFNRAFLRFTGTVPSHYRSNREALLH